MKLVPINFYKSLNSMD